MVQSKYMALRVHRIWIWTKHSLRPCVRQIRAFYITSPYYITYHITFWNIFPRRLQFGSFSSPIFNWVCSCIYQSLFLLLVPLAKLTFRNVPFSPLHASTVGLSTIFMFSIVIGTTKLLCAYASSCFMSVFN